MKKNIISIFSPLRLNDKFFLCEKILFLSYFSNQTYSEAIKFFVDQF